MIEKNIFDEINQKKLKLDELRPLSEETVKSLREHLEVVNHKEAILDLEDIIRNKEPFSE
ncbi:MAG: hypothetical protein RR523_03950 [Cetobacterium sp.]